MIANDNATIMQKPPISAILSLVTSSDELFKIKTTLISKYQKSSIKNN
jgi:hypothetical protein